MSPEFYAIIGVGVSTLGFLAGLTAVMFYLLSQTNKRLDKLEGNFSQIGQELNSLILRVSRLEWMLDAALRGRPVVLPAETDTTLSTGFVPIGKAAARRRMRRRQINRTPADVTESP